MKMKTVGGIVGTIAVLAVIGNLLPDDEPQATPTAQVTTATPTIKATTSAPTPTATTPFEEQDVTEQLKAAAGPDYADFIHEATITAPDQMQVDTTIVDDREDGGDDADTALAICKVARVVLNADGSDYVVVNEADGTGFAVAGLKEPGCVEY